MNRCQFSYKASWRIAACLRFINSWFNCSNPTFNLELSEGNILLAGLFTGFAKSPMALLQNLGNINHLLVHLIYMIRLVTYWELILHPGGDRFEILKSVKSK